MEIPASHGGVVTELNVKIGDKVKQGSVVVMLEAAGAVSEAKPAAAPATPAPAAPVSVAAPRLRPQWPSASVAMQTWSA
jgi:pyruvate/2-oxoglutarate dehydrogenase complex dihydrolipoamide acyltransferase (E2) component